MVFSLTKKEKVSRNSWIAAYSILRYEQSDAASHTREACRTHVPCLLGALVCHFLLGRRICRCAFPAPSCHSGLHSALPSSACYIAFLYCVFVFCHSAVTSHRAPSNCWPHPSGNGATWSVDFYPLL